MPSMPMAFSASLTSSNLCGWMMASIFFISILRYRKGRGSFPPGIKLAETMQYTKFGNTGMTVSRICLGGMSYGEGELPDWATGTRGWHVGKEEARRHFAA